MSLDLHAKFGDYITLVRIEVRERALASLRGSSDYGDVKGRGKLGMHDYIILTVIDTNHTRHTRFSFVAEKLKKRTLCGGVSSHIHIIPLSELSSASSASSSRFDWKFDNQIVPTTELNTILETTGHHYSVISDNCWSYATRTVETVLNLCLRYSHRKRGFEEALQQLEMVKRPLPRDVLRLFYKPLSHKNTGTLLKMDNWLESSLT